jgi:uncharacterized protein with von Willebrand factor type A (vWA) domain
MATFRYGPIDERLKALLDSFGDLMKLFQHLLLMMDGDPDRALKYMAQLQNLGYLDKSIDLNQFKSTLEKGRVIQETPRGNFMLTKKSERLVRRSALEEIFSNLRKGEFGQHRTSHAGDGGERLPETKPFEFGDDFDLLDLNTSIHNAMVRNAGERFNLHEQDLVVNETEHHTTCATVLLIDISHSMILYGEDRITPAKKVALALAELIKTHYPKDSLHVATFGDDAKEIKVEQIPYLGAGPYHTNTRAALQLSRRLLIRKKHPNKQVFMITDGKPSAIFDQGQLYVNAFGLDPKIVAMTLEEANVCRRYKIGITTFMLTDHPQLVDFVMKLTKINRGRAYLSNCNDIGKSVFVDYIKNRRKKFGG